MAPVSWLLISVKGEEAEAWQSPPLILAALIWIIFQRIPTISNGFI